jgi:hypothetical protein
VCALDDLQSFTEGLAHLYEGASVVRHGWRARRGVVVALAYPT